MKLLATVIPLRKLDPDEGLYNCTRLIIRAFSKRVIDAEIATGIHKNKRVLCYPLNDTFPSSRSRMTPLLEAIAPGKRQSVPCIYDGKGKINKNQEFNDNIIIPLKVIDKKDVTEFIVSPRRDRECKFDAIIRDPFDLSEYFHMVKSIILQSQRGLRLRAY